MSMCYISQESATNLFNISYREKLEALIGQKVRDLEALETQTDWMRFSIRTLDDNNMVAQWYLVQFPGCCGLVISTAAYIGTNFRHKGVGTLMNQFRQSLAKAMGYGVLVCTDVTDNEA